MILQFEAAEAAMWELVARYTGRVGYQRGVKSEGLSANPPVIDCSGWVGLLLSQAMRARNDPCGHSRPGADGAEFLQSWSDRIIDEIATRTGFVLDGQQITLSTLPRCACIGLKSGEPAWASNHPRLRGITHIVQLVRRPQDDAAFVSESFGGLASPGISLTPLAAWLARWEPQRRAAEMWAVDPFLLPASA